MRQPIFILLLLMSLFPVRAYSGTTEQDARQLNELAEMLYQQGKYQEARPLMQRALAIREKVLGPEHPDTAGSLNKLAMLYFTLGQYDQALPLYRRALAINKKVLGPEHPDTATSLNNLAELYITLGQYDQALPLHQRALAISEKVLGPEHADTATSLNNLAALYSTLGQYDQALPLYQRALVIREKVLGLEHADTATSLNNLAVLYRTLGQYDQALPLYQRALAITERVLGLEHADTATSLNNLAVLYRTLGQYDQALPLYQRALAIREKVLGPEHAGTATSLNNLALLYRTLGQYDQALPLYQLAYRSAQSARVPTTLKLVQSNLGNFYAKQDNPAAAIFYLKGAVNTMQAIRDESRGLDMALQKSLLKKNEIVYKQLADLLIDEGNLPEAQQVLSMLKEEEYFDFIRRDAKADPRSTRMNYSSAEKSFADRLDKLGNDGATLVDQLNELNKQAKLGLTSEQEKQRTRIKQQLAEQAKQTITLLNDIVQQLPAAKKQQLTEMIGKENLDQLRATLTSLGHGAVLLQYLVTDTRVRIILTTPQVQVAREAKIPAKELHRKIAAFRRMIEDRTLDPRPLAQELYQLLIAPVADDLKQANAQTLMLSLDGSLRYLPMSALHDGEAYLTERYPLAMYTEVVKDKLREKPDALWKVAGFGITHQIGKLPPLPAVRQELDGIIYTGSRKVGGGVLPGDMYLDKDFTQARLRDVLSRDYQVLHIASHFVFIPGTVAQSFLLLGDGKQLSLEALRTGGWKFDSVDMMTLSACETALGVSNNEDGREIEGFGALVQRQGAKSVLATLWSVEDQSTAILMQSLYRLRQEKGLNKAAALREAQLALISGKHPRPTVSGKSANPAKPYAHPFFWAPFILMGNWL